MSFLLSAKVVSGVGTSAVALDESFGLVEVIGSVCVISAALIEFVDPARPRKDLNKISAQECTISRNRTETAPFMRTGELTALMQ